MCGREAKTWALGEEEGEEGRRSGDEVEYGRVRSRGVRWISGRINVFSEHPRDSLRNDLLTGRSFALGHL